MKLNAKQFTDECSHPDNFTRSKKGFQLSYSFYYTYKLLVPYAHKISENCQEKRKKPRLQLNED